MVYCRQDQNETVFQAGEAMGFSPTTHPSAR